VYDPGMHDYTTDRPVWKELAPGHFVYGNAPELRKYAARLAETGNA